MRKLALWASAVCCVAAVANTTLADVETFDDPMGGWESRWFYQNTNAENYYVTTGNCDPNNRGNNPCGLWITDSRGCGSNGVGGPVCTIEFDPAYGATIQSFSLDISAYTSQALRVYDMSGNIVLDVPSITLTFDVCAGARYTATSNNGISRIVMDSSSVGGGQIEGNTAWDNLEAITGPGGLSLNVTGTCPGTVTVAWANATPSTTLAIVFGQNLGTTTIPTGPCAGTQLGLQGGVQLVNMVNSGSGSGSVGGNAGTAACGHFLQLVEAGSCATSNTDQIP